MPAYVEIDGAPHVQSAKDESLTSCGESIPADAWHHMRPPESWHRAPCASCLDELGKESNRVAMQGMDERLAKIITCARKRDPSRGRR